MRHLLLMSSLVACACGDDVADRTEQAAERVVTERHHITHHVGELPNEVEDAARDAARRTSAEEDFRNLRALRVASLRAEHSVAASQPLLIVVLSNVKPLSPALRRRLDENLAIFRQRLAHTREEIDHLASATASEWERRDDEMGRAMAGMFIARDASWQALDDNPRDSSFPES